MESLLALLTPLLKENKGKISGFLLVFLFWVFCFSYKSFHEIAIERNIFSGALKCDSTSLINISYPWIQVVKIDTRTRRTCIDCDCKTLNCRLIQFNKSGWLEFVKREGFRYYWLENRLSFNSGAQREYRGMDFILRGYAFDEQNHEFLLKLKE